jgi:DNA polymerase-3 subunit delta'
VPQEASPEAANALLKLLEEPPPDTTVILTAADPDSLLPTIRSRLLPVRVRSLPIRDVAAFLVHARGISEAAALVPARLGDGSIGRALAFLPDGPLEEMRHAARALLESALARDAAPRLAAALSQAPAGARATAFLGTLDFLATWLRDLAAVEAGAEEVVVNADSLPWLRETARKRAGLAAGIPGALRAVDDAAGLSRFNLNPQLTIAWLLRQIAAELRVPTRAA